MLSRRKFALVFASTALFLLAPGGTWASVARSVSLAQLVAGSERVAVVTPIEAHSTWEDDGGSKRIVTYTRARVNQQLAGSSTQAELVIRTLGGRVGNVGQIVHGEAELMRGRAQLVFLVPGPAGTERVFAMAQGHYPLHQRGNRTVLGPSPRLPEMVGDKDSAVHNLVGRSLDEATRLIEEAR